MRGFPLGVAEHRGQVERLAGEPRLEAGRGEQVVQRARQLEAVVGGVEGFQLERADPRDRRRLDLVDEAGQVEVARLLPRRLQDLGDQDVLPAPQRVGVDAGEAEQARRGRGEPLAEQLLVLPDGGGRRREGLHDGDGQPRRAARGVDGEVRGIPEPADPLAALPPLGEPRLPQLGLLGSVGLEGQPLPLGVPLVDPRGEVLRSEVREGEQQVGEVPLRVDGDRRDPVDQRLFQEREAEPGLAAPRHPDADRVGDQVLGVVEDQRLQAGLAAEVVRAAEVEQAELLEVWHVGPPHAERRLVTVRGVGV